MLTELQKQAAQAIVNIFETGKVLGDYASVVSVAGDPGGLTYGKAQTTINSGNLYLLIKAYTEAAGAVFANDLRPYLTRLRDIDPKLNINTLEDTIPSGCTISCAAPVRKTASCSIRRTLFLTASTGFPPLIWRRR
ncbi:MAG TPA: hypothetical protein VGB00_13730 [Pyrinomonadaceae bacterium]|jgi:hypothetical protein